MAPDVSIDELQKGTPTPGERILEIGPATGLFSVTVARRLVSGGTLDVFDIQQVMLEHTLRVGAASLCIPAVTSGICPSFRARRMERS